MQEGKKGIKQVLRLDKMKVEKIKVGEIEMIANSRTRNKISTKKKVVGNEHLKNPTKRTT